MTFKEFLNSRPDFDPGQIGDKTISFVEKICTANELTFADRVAMAPKFGLTTEIVQSDTVRDLIHVYYSAYKYSNKFQMLLNYQMAHWRISKLFLDEEFGVDADEQAKAVTLMDKMVDLSWKLEQKITTLFSEIYGDKDIQKIGAERVAKVFSPERRMKMKKAKEEKKEEEIGDRQEGPWR